MESHLEQYVRADKLQQARVSGQAMPDSPMAFIMPDNVAFKDEPSLLESVVNTVSLTLGSRFLWCPL